MELKQLSGKIQVKLNQFCESYASGFKRPEQKFVRQMIFGILKSGQVQLNAIGRALQERIPLKKTTQRLSCHLNKSNYWEEILHNGLRTQSFYLKRSEYMILDISDIQKEYAKKMGGLGRVYDGSRHGTGRGYWLCNVTGVGDGGSLIVPCYSELYSLQRESEDTFCHSDGKQTCWS